MNDPTEILDVLVGRCGYYKVVSVVKGEAFLDCGLPKDLFVAKSEQATPMRVGRFYVVYVYRDERSGRTAGSSKLNKYLYQDAPKELKELDEVDLLVYEKTPLGYKVVVGKDTWGVIYQDEVFKPLHTGDQLKGYVKKIRADGKLDICLSKPGFREDKDLGRKILVHLAKGDKYLSDKTPAQDIYRLFGVSKNKFKMAMSQLYKERKITITKTGCFELEPNKI